MIGQSWQFIDGVLRPEKTSTTQAERRTSSIQRRLEVFSKGSEPMWTGMSVRVIAPFVADGYL